DGHQYRRRDPPGARSRPRPYHRDDTGRLRHALSVQALQSGLPALEKSADPRMAGQEAGDFSPVRGRGVMTAGTEPLFRDDAYLKRAEAEVTGINERGGIVLDRTIFYAT